jgi:Domain of unknown function (DUF3127)
MTELKIEGTIVKEFPLRSGNGSKGGWKNKEYLIKYGDKYPKELIVVAWNDMIELMDHYIDSKVTMHLDLTSPENQQGKRFTTAKVWKVS